MSVSCLTRRSLLWGFPALAWSAGNVRAQGAASASKPERPRVNVALGDSGALYQLPLMVAAQLQYFAAEGLDVEFHEYNGAGPVQQALTKGTCDLAAGGLENAVMLRQRGLECQSFTLLARAPLLVFGVGTRALPGFRQLAQLRGCKIGIAAQDPATHWFAKQVMSRSGLGPDDVEYVALASPLAAVVALRLRGAIAPVVAIVLGLRLRHRNPQSEGGAGKANRADQAGHVKSLSSVQREAKSRINTGNNTYLALPRAIEGTLLTGFTQLCLNFAKVRGGYQRRGFTTCAPKTPGCARAAGGQKSRAPAALRSTRLGP